MSTCASVLTGTKVLDLGVGMSAALISKFLADCGADVKRLEPPDGDPFYEVYPAYDIWRAGIEKHTADNNRPNISSQLETVDICLVGGEDHPELDWQFDAGLLSRENPQLVVLNMQGSLPVDGEPPLIANEILAQARSGFSFENYTDRPMVFNYPVASYGVVFNAIIGIFTALINREMTGKGQIVATSLLEGALDASRSNWFQAEKPDMRFMAMVPKDSKMTIFKCKDGKYVHLMMGTPGSKERFYKLLNLNPDEFEDTLNDRGMPTGQGDQSKFWGDIQAFAKPIANINSADFINQLQEIDIPCVLVNSPGECWDWPQVANNKMIETDDQGRQYVGFPIHGL